MRLIYADKVEFKLYTPDEDENGIFRGFKSVSIVANETTIDAVPVIRCKDCIHYTGKWCTKYSSKEIDLNDVYKSDNDFCSQAERKGKKND